MTPPHFPSQNECLHTGDSIPVKDALRKAVRRTRPLKVARAGVKIILQRHLAAIACCFAVQCWGSPVPQQSSGEGDSCRLQDGIWSRVASAVITAGAYGCDSTGVQDATGVIQRAINDVAGKRGGVVYLPRGRYRLDGGLSIGRGVSLVGEKNGDGSPAVVFLAYGGRGKSDGALLRGVGEETSVEGVGILYPEQSPDQIVPYPWTFGGTLVKIRDVVLYNSYQALDANSSWGVNGAVIENLRGTVLSFGIKADFSSEFSWMHDVDFSPAYWAAAPCEAPLSAGQVGKIRDYIGEHLVALEVGRIDGMALYHFHAEGAKTPVLMRGNPKFSALVFGFGAVVCDIPKSRQEEGADPWYFGMHYANVDNVPEARGLSYVFARDPLPRRTDAVAFYNVTSPVFGARGDGITDDTVALQNALKTAGDQGGGTVFLPNGRYRITGSLVVPSGVELRGAFGAGRTRGDASCCLDLYCGKNSPRPDTDDAGITLQASAGIRGLSIFYPEQQFDSGGTDLVHYPFTIRGAGKRGWIVDVALIDSYNGIELGSRPCDDFLVRGVWGAAFSHGLVVSGGARGGHMERVAFTYALALDHLEAGLTGDQIFTSRTAIFHRTHSTAFSFGNCANVQGWGNVSFYSQVGMRFFADGGRGPASLDLWQSLLDASGSSTLVAEAGSNIRCFGLFSTYNPYDRDMERTTNWLEVSPAFTGPLSIYAKTIIQPSLSHPYDFTDGQVAFFDEVSLTTVNPPPHGATAPAGDRLNALDRNPRTFWDARPGTSLQADLGAVRTIDRFSVELCPFMSGGLVPKPNISLEYSLDGCTFQKAPTLRVRGSCDLPLAAPVECRYVRLLIDARNGGGIPVSRFDVFGMARDEGSVSSR